MDGKKKRQQNKKFWIAAKRLATSIGVSTNNATYIENDSDSNDSPDKCTNLIDILGSGQGMFVEDEAPHSTETSEGGDETDDKTWNMIDEDPVVSSDSLSSDEERNTCITSDLVSLINKHQIKHNAADDLLKLLKEHGNNTLPLSARTLLKTDKNVLTKEKSGMSYIYLGLEKSLVRNFEKYPSETRKSTPKIEVSLNVDGLPLFKNSNTCMWPVLCAIMIHPVTVFPVALTFGKSKPCNLDFLNDTIRELNHILQHGILYEESTIRVSLKCIVCDAPARAMIKATKLYSDYMHQSCLGVMRRLLLIWIKEKKETRLTARHVDDISKKLLQIQQFVPREFARKHGGHTSTTSVLPQPPQHGEGKAAPSNSSRCPKRSVFTTPERFDTSSRDCSPVPEQPKYIRMQNGKGKSMSVSSSEGGASGPQRPAAASEAELADVRFRKIMAHIKAMDEKLQILINIQQSRESREDVEDVLPASVSSLEELADLCTKVADKTFKKKLTQYLSALGGHSLGNTVRRIFRQLGTNSVWSYYSLKGKKGKKAFADIPLCSVVIKACLTSYTKAKMSEVEDEISEALKHAPKRKGGSKYKESEPKRRQQCSAQESSDSDD
ncbi:hypothetical protein Pcinc_015109 [Petrolisthes cinctipes]|uniref:DUF4806 domain-containing protein n=1 Tax=Petrolisthes cinctipes TaxID=88211 RepID=A0AAE1FVR0_PETCI|nr:hypothetical protein Pcinc_015109 [Petrolisthes cinctipes]